MQPKTNLQQDTVCLEQQIYASQENITQALVVMVDYLDHLDLLDHIVHLDHLDNFDHIGHLESSWSP